MVGTSANAVHMAYFSQTGFSIRLEWGAAAIRHLAPHADCVIVVDTMSFSTCVSLAVERGTIVYPFPTGGHTAQAYGALHHAEVASRERQAAQGWSLSPQSMRGAYEGLRLVLPSPNGSACAFQAGMLGNAVYCASFRNLHATAAACRHHASVLVVPCGERWPDADGLRLGVEDYIAAGGIVSALGRMDMSPEARAAAMAYEGMGESRLETLKACSSANELTERGFGGDVALCLEADASPVACHLQAGHFTAVPVA